MTGTELGLIMMFLAGMLAGVVVGAGAVYWFRE